MGCKGNWGTILKGGNSVLSLEGEEQCIQRTVQAGGRAHAKNRRVKAARPASCLQPGNREAASIRASESGVLCTAPPLDSTSRGQAASYVSDKVPMGQSLAGAQLAGGEPHCWKGSWTMGSRGRPLLS